MRLLLAYRFLRSKHNSSFINIISRISVLGIILGISILITVISVMNGFERELKERVLGFTSDATIYHNKKVDKESALDFNDLLLDKQIVGFSPYIEKESLLSSDNESSSVFFRAINPELERTVGVIHNNIIDGEYNDLNVLENGILIGSGIATKLDISVNDKVELYMQLKTDNTYKSFQYKSKYTVVGIFDVGIYEYNNAYVFINLDKFLNKLVINNKRNISSDTTRIKLDDPLKSYLFTSSFNKKYSNYYAQDWSITHQSLFTAINNEKRIMFIILMLIVAIAAFNIISSLLMLVTTKEKEIAILMTLGAKRKDIVVIFLMQGLLLGSIGIIFGVFLGVLMSANIDAIISFVENFLMIELMPAEIYHLSRIPSLINNEDIIFIVIYTFILTIISSIYPAIKASSIKPADILRGAN